MPDEIPQLYQEQLPISTKKYNDLASLCKSGVIKQVFHEFYKKLPVNNRARDELMGPTGDGEYSNSDEEIPLIGTDQVMTMKQMYTQCARCLVSLVLVPLAASIGHFCIRIISKPCLKDRLK